MFLSPLTPYLDLNEPNRTHYKTPTSQSPTANQPVILETLVLRTTGSSRRAPVVLREREDDSHHVI